jgi:hypothetical protein
MIATIWPAVTLWPGVTIRAARVPAEGAVSVATALALTVAEASTTSVTSPRSAAPSPTGLVPPVHADAVSATEPMTRINAARGVRRTAPILARGR